MKTRHLLLAISITAICGVSFSVIKLGLATVDPLLLAGIRVALCALPAIFFISNLMCSGATSLVTVWSSESDFGVGAGIRTARFRHDFQ